MADMLRLSDRVGPVTIHQEKPPLKENLHVEYQRLMRKSFTSWGVSLAAINDQQKRWR